MKRFLISLFALLFSFGFVMDDAEAKRLGGGKSFGMQRSAPAKQDAAAAPQRQQQTPAPTSAGAPKKNSWMGPIAGLAAGLGLAALFSHLGLGEEMASFLMLALLAMAAMMLYRLFVRRNVPTAAPAGTAAGSRLPHREPSATSPMNFEGVPQNAAAALDQSPAGRGGSAVRSFPPGFDAIVFAREAKLNFIRMQAAFDAGNLDDLRAFTTPEVFAELSMQLAERGDAVQTTDVLSLDADILECADEASRHIVSVRFTGRVRESADDTASVIDEIWHLSKAASGPGGWVVAGIQQV